MRKVLFAITLLIGLQLNAQTEYRFNTGQDGFSLGNRSNTTTTIVHNVSSITLEQADREGLEGQFITLSGIHVSNTAGAPDLPSGSTFVAIPNGSTPSVRMVSAKTKTLCDVDLIPAPEPQLDDDNSPAVYRKDMDIYGRNAFYPASPFTVSEVLTIRGVEMVQVGVMPFQYNPVTKELIVYENIELELSTEGGDGTYGDLRYRTPDWDQILSDMLLNRDQLPEVDYGERLRKHYSNRETGCEYIIITPDNDEFVQLADSIRRFRIDQGVPTEIYTVSQCGGNDGNSIRSFIRNAYNHWDMPPAAVLILGDHDTDPTKGVVSFTMNNHPGGDGYNPYISDHAYAVTGNNHMPNIVLARITGRDYEELYHMIKKDLDYERTPPTNPNFYDKPITAMGFQLERWFQLCSEIVNGFWEHELGKHPVRVNAIYEGNPGSRWSSNENTNAVVNYFGPNGCGYIPSNMSHLTDWSGDGNKVNDAINSGAFILQHRDHGSNELWGEPSYNISHIKRLVNPDLTFVMSCNCLTGRFNYNGQDGCFAEAFHRHQHGALGLIAATQVSYSFVNDVFVWGMYDNMWPDLMPTYGIDQHATNFIRPAFGNASGKFFLRQSSWADDYCKEITYYLFHHHGDAYLTLYSEMPQPLDVEMLPVLMAGIDSYQVKADEGATICLTVDDQIIGFDHGTGQPQIITVTPQVPGTIVKLTITKQNHYRYEHLLNTIPTEGPYLIFNAVQINDPTGNGNQAADYNETCDLNVSIHNVGSESIGNITATLSCPNPKVEVLQGQSSFGTVVTDAVLQADNAFTVHFDETLNDGEKVRLYLDMDSGENSYRDSIDFRIKAPVLSCTQVSFTNAEGEPTDRFFKGETTMMVFDITNSGQSKSLDLANQLSIRAPFLDITENPLPLNAIEAGETAQVTFQVNLHQDALKGNILDYQFEAQSGSRSILLEDRVSLGYTTEDFEDEELNASFQWSLGSGSKKWYVAEDETATEGHCLRSPALNNNGSAKLMIGVKCAKAETFTFSYKTSTEAGDVLELDVNSTVVGSWSGISEDWQQASFELKEGQNLLRFIFKKNAQGSGGDDCVMIDHLLFPPMEELFVYAGDNEEVCPNEAFIPNSYVLHPQTILWSTNGDGTFDDPSLERPSYSFGANDIANGQVVLHLTAIGDNNDQQSSEITLSLFEDLTTLTPGTPEGNALVDLRLVTQTSYQAPASPDYEYAWTLDPETAGELSFDGAQATVLWTEGYTGTAILTYSIGNTCGNSESSQPLSIRVMNSTAIDETSAHSIAVYPNPTDGQVRVSANGLEGEVTVRIIDVLGRVVVENSGSAQGDFEAVLSTTNLRSGLYDIQVINNGTTLNTRLLVR